jgi:phosphatidylglycerol:prolipoprotein diacylglycerol transferase
MPSLHCGTTAASWEGFRPPAEPRRYHPPVIDPIAIQIGPLSIHWYGLIIASAVLGAALLGTSEARRRGEDPDVGWAILLWALVAGVAGARIYHVIHEWDFYRSNPELILQIWKGGLGIPGAIAGGGAAVLLYTRAKGLPTARWVDIFAIALPLGQAIGRLGNFVNQELYGPPTTLPWGIPIDAAHRVGPWTNLAAYPESTTRFVPLFAYEAIASLVTLAAMLYISRRFAKRLFDGDMFLIYLMFYGLVRSYLETYRVDNWMIAGIPTATWLGLGGFVVAAALLWLRHARGWGTPASQPRPRMEPDETGSAGTPADAEAG